MESNPDIDKDVEHIPVKSPSRRKIWLPFLVIATLIVAAAVITTAVLLASKDEDSKNLTKKKEPSVTESFETTAMRTTHHLQQTDFTTENATSSRITTPVTATNSIRISTSSSVTQLQAVSLDPITSSLATVLQTSLQKTYANSNATPVSLIQTYASNVSPVKLTRAKTSRYPKTTHYNLTSANPITSRAPPQSVQTTINIYWKDWNTSPIYFCASTNPI